MVKKTLKYKRILPDVSVSLLKDKDTGKKSFRHRWVDKGKNSSSGTQQFKDYSTRTHKTIEQFEHYIRNKHNYN